MSKYNYRYNWFKTVEKWYIRLYRNRGKSYYYYSFIRKTFFVLTKNCSSNEVKNTTKNYYDSFWIDIPSLSKSDFNLMEEEIDFIKSNKNINRLIQLILVNL